MRYDYECEKCGHIQEESHSMKDSPVIKCEKCKSKKTHKVMVSPEINMYTWGGGSHPDEVT
jgi:putative FmdB family regulatory protein